MGGDVGGGGLLGGSVASATLIAITALSPISQDDLHFAPDRERVIVAVAAGIHPTFIDDGHCAV